VHRRAELCHLFSAILEYCLVAKCKLREPKNGVFGKMFESNETDVGNQIWICHNEGIDDMYISPNFRVLNSKGLDSRRQEIQAKFLYLQIF